MSDLPTLPAWHCWADDIDEAEGADIEAASASDAAELYVELVVLSEHWTEDEQPISVRGPDGALTSWGVTARQEIHFASRSIPNV